jgi:predicted nucleotidyltransferase
MNLQSDIRHFIDYFKGKDEISVVYIFGSAVNGKETDESDIDIAVLINDHKKGRRTYDSLKKTFYSASPNTASPFLKHHIIKTGKVLLDRNRRLRKRFTANAIIEYLDYKPIEDICLKAVAGRFRRVAVGR